MPLPVRALVLTTSTPARAIEGRAMNPLPRSHCAPALSAAIGVAADAPVALAYNVLLGLHSRGILDATPGVAYPCQSPTPDSDDDDDGRD